MGYTNVRHYHGGMIDWTESGQLLEKGEAEDATTAVRVRVHRPATESVHKAGSVDRFIHYLGDTSFGSLLGIWIGLVVACAVIYTVTNAISPGALLEHEKVLPSGFGGFLSALYFSFVTATSVGFGDIIPLGFMRAIAIAEAAGGLILFGCVVSKLVSRRQEELLEATHQIAFDERLGRVRTNLHLLLAEFQSISEACSTTNLSPERVMTRMEGASTLFAAELRVIHQLLYQIENAPEEFVMEALLSEVSADLREILEVLPEERKLKRSTLLNSNLKVVRGLAEEICSDCVPRQYAPQLRTRMDEIQAMARRLG